MAEGAHRGFDPLIADRACGRGTRLAALVGWNRLRLEDRSVFVITVAIEFAVAGLGAGVLAARRKNDIIPAWIALVIGVHLFSMAPLLSYPLLYVVAALVSMGALAAIPTEVMVTRGCSMRC